MASTEGDKEPSHASPTDLLSSAKLVADAAQSTFGGSKAGEEVDKGKVAGAAADLLDAASRYGNLDQQKGGVGGYMDQAETYLREYSSSTTTQQPAAAAAHDPPAAAAPLASEEPPAAPASGAGEGHADGGLGGYVKLAKGFFN